MSEDNGEIVFLHKIVSGAASKSYGIHVAKIAGVPKVLLEDAERKLESLESWEESKEGIYASLISNNNKPSYSNGTRKEDMQISLFSSPEETELVNRVKSLDLMELTPSQAIRILEELKSIIGE